MTRKLLIKLTKGVGIILNGKNINPFLARNGNDSKSHVKYKQTNKVAIHCVLHGELSFVKLSMRNP